MKLYLLLQELWGRLWLGFNNRERNSKIQPALCVYLSVCVCARECVCERKRGGVKKERHKKRTEVTAKVT